MTAYRLDDQGCVGDNVVAAGNEAYGAVCRAGQWSSGHLTDGVVPQHVCLLIAKPKVWQKAAGAGLIELGADGTIRILDYLVLNDPAEKVRAYRAEKAQMMARLRDRRKLPKPPDEPPSSVTDNVTGNGIGGSEEVTGKLPLPLPQPLPDHTHTARAGAHAEPERGPMSPNARVIAAALAKWPVFSTLAPDVPDVIEGLRMERGTPLTDVLESVSDCGAATEPGLLLRDQLRGKLMSFVRNAGKKRQEKTNGSSRTDPIPKQPRAKPGEYDWRTKTTKPEDPCPR